MLIKLIKTIALLLLSGHVMAGDYYVITNTLSNQKEAQEKAALRGGWVLNTNLYSDLKKDLFAVVHGPFSTYDSAKNQLDEISEIGDYADSYVKDAGNLLITKEMSGKSVDPVIIAMLLGEVRIDIKHEQGSDHPCEPSKPYDDITLNYMSLGINAADGAPETEEITLDFGQSARISETGELERMRRCLE
ncbi:hypothetical protein [Thiothrix nivea]|uniref:Sporulation domain-containing protein n=1 Tax=Thiothrix nivea (strain ATCC 35100 / DSM 5205 / JP2) TaxID=870187 RepID=A0A656HKU5_THINJ|nr:hypothetical protein [Thiothrix nivea]EIJ36903.1 hypothetical protein Thini_4425 [Thiothrix nivea DSM 5205]